MESVTRFIFTVDADEVIAAFTASMQSVVTQAKEEIMATQAELAQDLRDINTKIGKIGTETGATLDKVAALEAALAAAGNTSPEVDQALADLKAQAQRVDDLVPDVPAGGGTNEPGVVT